MNLSLSHSFQVGDETVKISLECFFFPYVIADVFFTHYTAGESGIKDNSGHHHDELKFSVLIQPFF